VFDLLAVDGTMTETWTVTPDAERPARRDGTCFYCREPVGGQHQYKCVLNDRPVRMRMIFEWDAVHPVSSTKEWIEYFYNDGTWCADNIYPILEAAEESCCLCCAKGLRFEVADE
jgi:hypothetical protein